MGQGSAAEAAVVVNAAGRDGAYEIRAGCLGSFFTLDGVDHLGLDVLGQRV